MRPNTNAITINSWGDSAPAPEERAMNVGSMSRWSDAFGDLVDVGNPVGTPVSEKRILGLPAFYAGTRFLARAISGLPRRVMIEDDRGQRADRNHPLNRALNRRANRYGQTGKQVFEQAVFHASWWGNGFVWAPRRPDGRIELYNLLPDRTEVAHVDETRYVLHWPQGRMPAANPEAIPLDEVIHLYAASYDGLNGIPLVDLFKTNLSLYAAGEEFGAHFWSRGTLMQGAVETEQKLTPEQMKALRNSIRDGYSGLRNSMGMPVLPYGAKLKMLGVNPEAAQFLEGREFSVKDIGRVLQLPSFILNDYSDSKWANIEHQQIALVQYSLKGWIDNIESECDTKLFTEEEQDQGYSLHLDLNGLMRGDYESRQRGIRTAIEGGWMHRAEARRLENLGEGPEELELYLRPANLVVAKNDIGNSVSDEDTVEPHDPDQPQEGQERGADFEQDLEQGLDQVRAEPKTQPKLDLKPLVADALERIANKEIKAVESAVKRHLDKGDEEAFRSWTIEFGEKHSDYIINVMKPIAAAAGHSGEDPRLGMSEAAERADRIACHLACELTKTLEQDDVRSFSRGWPIHRQHQIDDVVEELR